MKKFHKIQFAALVFLLSFSTVSFAQIYNDEDEQVITPSLTFNEGEIILNDKTTIKSLININFRKKEGLVTLTKIDNKISYIPNSEILLVTISSTNKDTVITDSFERINESGKLYRIVGTGKRKIYDESTKPITGYLVGAIFVKDESKAQSLYNFWSSGPKQDLIDYINKRDHKVFTKKDFKNMDDLLNYAVN